VETSNAERLPGGEFMRLPPAYLPPRRALRALPAPFRTLVVPPPRPPAISPGGAVVSRISLSRRCMGFSSLSLRLSDSRPRSLIKSERHSVSV
jgi:hypothetical protein